MPASARNGTLLAALTAILGLQLAGAYALTRGERPPASPELGALPHEIGAWTLAGEQAMDPAVVAYLRPDNYIDRDYQGGAAPRINLLVAYFKSLKSGYGPHSPAVCLPGAGWMAKQAEVIQLSVPGPLKEIPVNQYVLEKDKQNLLVLYWYQNDRRIWAEEFRAKLFMLPDLLRYHRSDVALVRIITPLDIDALAGTKARLAEFVRLMFPLLAAQFSPSSS